MKLTATSMSAPASGARTLEQVVAHPPLLAAVVAKQLRAGHEEDPPALQPLLGRRGAVGDGENAENLFAARIDVREPGVGGLLVVRSVPAPAPHQPQVLLEAERE